MLIPQEEEKPAVTLKMSKRFSVGEDKENSENFAASVQGWNNKTSAYFVTVVKKLIFNLIRELIFDIVQRCMQISGQVLGLLDFDVWDC